LFIEHNTAQVLLRPYFHCHFPKDNAEPNQLAKITGRLPEVLCKTCSARTSADTDDREGFYTGHIKFGPNVLRGKVSEAEIIEYRVHWTMEGTSTVGPTVAIVPRIRKARTTEVFCKCSDAYKAVLAGVKIPTGATGLMVLPVETTGLVMPVGSFASISDLATTAHPRRSSAPPMWKPLAFTLPAIVAMLVCGALREFH